MFLREFTTSSNENVPFETKQFFSFTQTGDVSLSVKPKNPQCQVFLTKITVVYTMGTSITFRPFGNREEETTPMVIEQTVRTMNACTVHLKYCDQFFSDFVLYFPTEQTLAQIEDIQIFGATFVVNPVIQLICKVRCPILLSLPPKFPMSFHLMVALSNYVLFNTFILQNTQDVVNVCEAYVMARQVLEEDVFCDQWWQFVDALERCTLYCFFSYPECRHVVGKEILELANVPFEVKKVVYQSRFYQGPSPAPAWIGWEPLTGFKNSDHVQQMQELYQELQNFTSSNPVDIYEAQFARSIMHRLKLV